MKTITPKKIRLYSDSVQWHSLSTPRRSERYRFLRKVKGVTNRTRIRFCPSLPRNKLKLSSDLEISTRCMPMLIPFQSCKSERCEGICQGNGQVLDALWVIHQASHVTEDVLPHSTRRVWIQKIITLKWRRPMVEQ